MSSTVLEMPSDEVSSVEGFDMNLYVECEGVIEQIADGAKLFDRQDIEILTKYINHLTHHLEMAHNEEYREQYEESQEEDDSEG